jgi:hypothetical protein
MLYVTKCRENIFTFLRIKQSGIEGCENNFSPRQIAFSDNITYFLLHQLFNILTPLLIIQIEAQLTAEIIKKTV